MDELPISFGFIFDSETVKVSDATKGSKSFGSFNRIKFDASVSFEKKTNKIAPESVKYELLNGDSMSFGLNQEQGKYRLVTENYQPVRQPGRAWMLPPPENFFKSIYYFGPFKDYPERFYQFSEKFDPLVARWLIQMGLISDFRVVPIGEGRKEYEVRVKVQHDSPEVLITEVGFGISQVLPVLVQCFYVSSNSILFFEQPEIHLHPSVQYHLGDLFIEAISAREKGHDRNIQIVVESHSEHLIRRIQRRIAEEVIKPKDVAIYFISLHKGLARIEELQIDLYGNIANWPDSFFGDEIEDLSAITRAARERRRLRPNG